MSRNCSMAHAQARFTMACRHREGQILRFIRALAQSNWTCILELYQHRGPVRVTPLYEQHHLCAVQVQAGCCRGCHGLHQYRTCVVQRCKRPDGVRNSFGRKLWHRWSYALCQSAQQRARMEAQSCEGPCNGCIHTHHTH